MGEFEGSGWTRLVEPPFLLFEPDDPKYQRPVYDPDKAKFTPDEEIARIRTQINESDGFDIDFSIFRCVFNYHQAYFDWDEFVDAPETTGDLLKSLSQKSLEDFNEKEGTQFEFVKVVKANFHVSAGIMFLITFEVIDPYDGLIKPFQARVLHVQNNFTEYVFCRPKPKQGVEYFGTVKKDEEKVVKKPRLEE